MNRHAERKRGKARYTFRDRAARQYGTVDFLYYCISTHDEECDLQVKEELVDERSMRLSSCSSQLRKEPLKGKVAEAFAMCFVDMCAAVDRGWWGGCG